MRRAPLPRASASGGGSVVAFRRREARAAVDPPRPKEEVTTHSRFEGSTEDQFPTAVRRRTTANWRTRDVFHTSTTPVVDIGESMGAPVERTEWPLPRLEWPLPRRDPPRPPCSTLVTTRRALRVRPSSRPAAAPSLGRRALCSTPREARPCGARGSGVRATSESVTVSCGSSVSARQVVARRRRARRRARGRRPHAAPLRRGVHADGVPRRGDVVRVPIIALACGVPSSSFGEWASEPRSVHGRISRVLYAAGPRRGESQFLETMRRVIIPVGRPASSHEATGRTLLCLIFQLVTMKRHGRGVTRCLFPRRATPPLAGLTLHRIM